MKSIVEILNESQNKINSDEYITFEFPHKIESLKNAPVGTTYTVMNFQNKKKFWNDDEWTYHCLIKRKDGKWEEFEKHYGKRDESFPVKNGVVITSNDILKLEDYEIHLSIKIFDKSGNLLCIPGLGKLDDDIRFCTSMEFFKVEDIKKMAEENGERFTGRTRGFGYACSLVLDKGVWYTKDCDEYRSCFE